MITIEDVRAWLDEKMFLMKLWLIPLRATMYILLNIIPKRLA